MKLLKKKSFWIILVIIIVIGVIVVSVMNKGQKGPEYTTAKVEQGTLKQTVSATGSIESATEIDLNFKSSGKLGYLSVKVGDEVIQGQLLASQESSYQASQVANNQAAVDVAQSNLDKVLAGASGEDIGVSQKSVESAEATLVAKQTALSNLQASELVEMANLRDTALTNLNNKYFIGTSVLETVDDTLDYEDAQNTLSINNLSLLSTVNSSYPSAVTNLAGVQPFINQAELSKDDSDIIFAIDQLKVVLNEISTLAGQTFEVLQNTTLSPTLSLTELDTLKSGIATEQTNLNTALNTLQTDKNNLLNTTQDFENSIATAVDDLASAQAALNLAEAQLDLKMAGPRDFEIAYYQAQLNQAKANLQASYSNLSDYSVRAPVNGTITEINSEVGEQTSLATPVIMMIAESNLQIEVDIPESDIAKISVGDKSEITLDAFGDDTIFNGSITFIDPAATIIQDVVYYKVKVSFEETEEDVKPGMTANIDILTMEKADVLMIPSRAVKKIDGQQMVQVLENGQAVDKEVVTGFKGDDTMLEIISGLEEGEDVITYIKNGK